MKKQKKNTKLHVLKIYQHFTTLFIFFETVIPFSGEYKHKFVILCFFSTK